MLVGASVGLQHCEHPSLHSPALLLQDSVLYLISSTTPACLQQDTQNGNGMGCCNMLEGSAHNRGSGACSHASCCMSGVAGRAPLLLPWLGLLVILVPTPLANKSRTGPDRPIMAGQQLDGRTLPNPPPRCPYCKITHRAFSSAASQSGKDSVGYIMGPLPPGATTTVVPAPRLGMPLLIQHEL